MEGWNMLSSSKKTVLLYSSLSVLSFALLIGFSIMFYNSSFAQSKNVKIGADAAPVVPSEAAKAFNDALVAVSEAVKPTVVAISVVTKSQSMNQIPGFEEFFKFFGFPEDEPRQERRGRGAGSGVIISEDGYIVTNNHVVEDAVEDGIKVITVDQKEFKAKLIGRDPLTDLAVIKIEASGLKVAHFAKIEDVKIGEFVIAVGNPLGLNFTVTSGIVSAIGRGAMGLRRDPYAVEYFIQTDAPINPGNSGGGLFDINGSLVGINSAIATQTGTYIGYGFAIPVDLVHSVVLDLIEDGKIDRGYVGVVISTVDEITARNVGLPDVQGVMVNDVLKDSPADKAGIEIGDVILELDGKQINTSNQLQSYIAQKRVGDKVKVTLWRDKKKINKTVTLERRKGDDVAENESDDEPSGKKGDTSSNEPVTFDKFGFSVTPLSSEQKKEFDVKNGVYISRVQRFSHAAERGLSPNGVIVKVDRKDLKTTGQLKDILESKQKGETVMFQVKYKERNQIVALEIQ